MSSEVKRFMAPTNDTCDMDSYQMVVLASDYAALEAECERLRGVMMEIATRHFAGNLSNADKEKELDQYLSEGIRQLEEERDAALSQLAAIQGGMGEVVETVAWAVTWARVGDTPERTEILQADVFDSPAAPRFYSYREPLMTVAQHQRITAAMAAEVERWERNFRDIHEPALRDAHAYIQELRAELAEVKGREAVAVGWALTLPDGRVTLEKAYPRWIDGDMGGDGYSAAPLYTAPPASPDVEGLVKALELWLADYDEVAANPDFEPHPHVAERVTKSRAALSTWRQAHTPSTLPASSAEE